MGSVDNTVPDSVDTVDGSFHLREIDDEGTVEYSVERASVGAAVSGLLKRLVDASFAGAGVLPSSVVVLSGAPTPWPGIEVSLGATVGVAGSFVGTGVNAVAGVDGAAPLDTGIEAVSSLRPPPHVQQAI